MTIRAMEPIRIRVEDAGVGGEVHWRRFPTSEGWTTAVMRREGDDLLAELPHQPPAGKLEYQVRLTRGEEHRTFPPLAAVTRFKGHVPAAILAPHVLMMFLGMLVSNRAGLESLSPAGETRRLAWLTLGLLGVGGLVLGPIVQKHAFDAYWTGWPLGTDLTDDKTAAMWLVWIGAAVLLQRRRDPRDRTARIAVILAALVMLAVYVIPHSLRGSQLDYGAAKQGGAAAEIER